MECVKLIGVQQYTNAAPPQGIYKNIKKKLDYILLDNIGFAFFFFLELISINKGQRLCLGLLCIFKISKDDNIKLKKDEKSCSF